MDPYFGAEARYFCAAVATCLSCIAFLPYLRDTILWRTSPQRSSWLIWGVLSSISFASQVSEGATSSLFYAGIQCGGTLVIFLFAISRGAGSYLRGRDGAVLAAATMGLVLWYLTDSAAWALGISCSISLLGGSVTVWKCYQNPESETVSFWVMSFMAAVMALGSVGAPDPVLLAYPAYLFILNAAILVAMVLGRVRTGAYAIVPARV